MAPLLKKKSQLATCMSLFLDLLPLNYFSIFTSMPRCLHYYSFILGLASGSVCLSTLFLFFFINKIVLAILGAVDSL